jgi:hypothetical protein
MRFLNLREARRLGNPTFDGRTRHRIIGDRALLRRPADEITASSISARPHRAQRREPSLRAPACALQEPRARPFAPLFRSRVIHDFEIDARIEPVRDLIDFAYRDWPES